jgi:hypothetical protein
MANPSKGGTVAYLRDLLAPHKPQVKDHLADLYDQRDALIEEIREHEAFLALVGGTGADPEPELKLVAEPNGHANGNGNGHKRLTEKRAAVLEIMGERPGRWTPAQVRKALARRDIDPHAGTPVKNILWHLAKDGTVRAAGNGVYEFPPLNVEAEREEVNTR